MIIDEYLKERKEVLYFIGGLGLGVLFGKSVIFPLLFGLGYIIWKKRKENE